MKTLHKMYCPTRHRSLKAGKNETKSVKKGMAFTSLLFLLVFFTAISSNLNAAPADEIDWGWSIAPTFPNEAYGPRTDVNPDGGCYLPASNLKTDEIREVALGLLSVPDEYQLNFAPEFHQNRNNHLVNSFSTRKRAFGYPRCKLGLVEKGSLSCLYSVT